MPTWLYHYGFELVMCAFGYRVSSVNESDILQEVLNPTVDVRAAGNINGRANRFRKKTDGTVRDIAASINLLMDVYVDLCCSFGLPVWIASLLHTAKRLRVDRARRKKVYRLLQRKLMFHKVGVKEGNMCQPTYVYPEEVKMLIRSVFSQDICDYPDPCHDQVVVVTVEDLHKV